METRSEKYARYLGEIYKELLIPECIVVATDIRVGPDRQLPVIEFGDRGNICYRESIDLGMSVIPIVIRSLEKNGWTERQKKLLPDGIRDIHKKDYLLNFNCEKPVKVWDIEQGVANWFFFSKAEYPKAENAIASVITSFPLKKKFVRELRYAEVSKGVYRSADPMADCVQLLVIPELPDESGNAPIRFFSSDTRVREQAVRHLHELGICVQHFIL